MQQFLTVRDILTYLASTCANPKALSSYVDDTWVSLSTREMLEEIKYLALALHQIGVKREDKIGIIAVPSTRWTIADLAIMVAGGVVVPLFANISEENFLYILKQTKLNITFLGGDEAWTRYNQDRDFFKLAINLDYGIERDGVRSYNSMLELGRKTEREQPGLYAQLLSQIRPEDVATIVYTSGTTGTPKGAVHTNRSMFSLIHTDPFAWDWKKDRYLSVLPLAHIFARSLNLILLAWGISIYYFNDLKNLTSACQEVRPTILVVVPRLLEKVYSKMLAKVHNASFIKRHIGEWAFSLPYVEKPNAWQRLRHFIAEKLVYKKLRAALGGSARVILSGGAALDPFLYRFFLNAGFPIFEGWGLTEACPVSVNRIGRTKIGSIGIPIEGLQVIANETGELLVRGSNVMKEYFKNREGTEQALDREGWLHTGDQGSIDKEGFVFIVGRIKELYKTSTGEMVAPVPIEQALCQSPFIEMAMVIADKRKFTSCLLVPDFEVIKTMKNKHEMGNLTDQEFLESSLMKRYMQKLLDRVNAHLNHWEQVRAYRFLPEPLTIANGELTPSMKIVREVVSSKYKHLIDAIYEEV